MSSNLNPATALFRLPPGWADRLPPELHREILHWLLLRPSIIRSLPDSVVRTPPAYEGIISVDPLRLRAYNDRHRQWVFSMPHGVAHTPPPLDDPLIWVHDQRIRFSPTLDIVQVIELMLPLRFYHPDATLPDPPHDFPTRRLISTCMSLATHPNADQTNLNDCLPGLRDAYKTWTSFWRRCFHEVVPGDPIPLGDFGGIEEATFTYAIADPSLFLPASEAREPSHPYLEFECHTAEVGERWTVWFRALNRADVEDALAVSRRDWLAPDFLEVQDATLTAHRMHLPGPEAEPAMVVRLRIVRPGSGCPAMAPTRAQEGNWVPLERADGYRNQGPGQQRIARLHYGRIHTAFRTQKAHAVAGWAYLKLADF